MRPLLPYYGGKQHMAKRIVDLLPRHTVYVEPFCGGASVFSKKPWPPVSNNDHYREVLNDLDGRVVNLYRVAKDPDAFAEFQILVTAPRSRAEHSRAKEYLRNNPEPLQSIDPEAAAAYWVATVQSFGCICGAGWRTCVFKDNSSATYLRKIERLPEYLDRMLGVHLESRDAIDVIKTWDSPQTLFYCDPPYPGADQRGYKHPYTQENLAELCQALDECNGSFALSCYANEAVPGHWTKHEFESHCAVSCKGTTGAGRDKTKAATDLGDRKRTECVWVMDRSDDARGQCKAIWKKWAEKGFQWGGDKRNYAVGCT